MNANYFKNAAAFKTFSGVQQYSDASQKTTTDANAAQRTLGRAKSLNFNWDMMNVVGKK